jgi:hypothetical protein
MDANDNGTRDFPLCANCCVLLQSGLVYINQPKMLVTVKKTVVRKPEAKKTL